MQLYKLIVCVFYRYNYCQFRLNALISLSLPLTGQFVVLLRMWLKWVGVSMETLTASN